MLRISSDIAPCFFIHAQAKIGKREIIIKWHILFDIFP